MEEQLGRLELTMRRVMGAVFCAAAVLGAVQLEVAGQRVAAVWLGAAGSIALAWSVTRRLYIGLVHALDGVVDQAPHREQHLLARSSTMRGELDRERGQDRGHALPNLLARLPRVLERLIGNNARKRPPGAVVSSSMGSPQTSIAVQADRPAVR